MLNTPSFILYFFCLIFLLIFIITYGNNYRKVKKKKFDSIKELNDIAVRFKIDKKKINYKKEIKYITFINSFIIASVGTFVTCLDIMIILQLALGFVLLLALIYSLYEIYGRYLAKKIRREENEF